MPGDRDRNLYALFDGSGEPENSAREALKMGYSLVDTANAYVNMREPAEGGSKTAA